MLPIYAYRLTAPELGVPPAEAEPQDVAQRFYENLTAELHATAVGIAVVATAVNSLLDWRIVILPADIARFSPQTSTLKAMLTVLHGNDRLDGWFTQDLRTFLGELDAARTALDYYLDECELITPERAGMLHARLLQGLWQPLSRTAKSIVVEIERSMPVELPDLYTQNTRVVSALLTGASNGLRPCLNGEGKLYVPPLPQRRRWPRRTVLQNCVIFSAGNVQSAFVRDASAGGLGLGRVSGLKRGDKVRIEMANGRKLQGTVVWTSVGSAGVRFEQSLAPDDSLIAV